ncbi:Invasion associated protein p60 [hydrothermal vent metagenome]|uniref:Invasion associated protein p60 n=1 Tax=hydrothermal vent metagenome TaxID=652676 RepID=A0A1W1BM03_9ZZZZ
MGNRTVVTVSSIKGIQRYTLPQNLKIKILVVLLLTFLPLVFVVYYIHELNISIETLHSKNEILEGKVEKNKFLQLVLNDKESILESVKQEKDILEETLEDRIERLIIDKNKIQIEQQFTLEIKNTREDSLVRLTNMLSDIQTELKKESRTSQKLQNKLSLNIKIDKARIAREEERKARELAEIRREKERKQRIASEKSNKERTLKRIAKSKLRKRYVWGAVGPRTFDCSGYTSYVFKKLGVKLPRVSRGQSKFGKLVKRENLQVGDLLFFDTGRKGVVNHVGIYLGNDKFIHASSAKKRVVISRLSKGFYSSRYKWARRVM